MKKAILLICGLLMLIFFAGIVHAEPSITISPSSEHRGHEVTISGSGFTPGITLYFEYADYLFEDYNMIVGKKSGFREIIVAEDGTFSLRTIVEEAYASIAIGNYNVEVWNSNGEYASTNFEVLPGILWTEPSSGPPGTKIKIYGSNFRDTAGEEDDLVGVWKYPVKPDPDNPDDVPRIDHIGQEMGFLELWNLNEYYIPNDATLGLHKIIVGDDGGVSADFYVTPSTSPTPVPEYPTIALPIVALIGLVFILQRHRINK